MMGDMRVVELSHVIDQKTEMWPGGVKLQQCLFGEDTQWPGIKQQMTLGVDVGTHVDSPFHWCEEGRAIHQLSAEELNSPLVLLDVRDKVVDADYGVCVADIEAYEECYGPITKGSFVAAFTGWGSRFSQPEAYINNLHFPGFTPEVAELLLERGVSGIGIDTLSLDIGFGGTDFPVHQIMLVKGDKYQVENLNIPEGIPPSGAYISVAPLRISGAPEMEARVFAYVPPNRARCYCGGVTWQTTASVETPRRSLYCHCKSCRRAHAAPMYQVCYVPEAKFQLLNGEENIGAHSTRPESFLRHFCKLCGTRTYNTLIKEQGIFIGLFPSTFEVEDDPVFAPTLHYHSKESLLDLTITFPDDGLPRT